MIIYDFRWEDSGRKKGFGYIEFQDEEAADAACGVHKVISPRCDLNDLKPILHMGGNLLTVQSPILMSLFLYF